VTQVLYCSTLLTALTLAAAIDADRLGPRDRQRVVVVSDNGPTPEIGEPLIDSPGLAVLRSRVDRVVSWNAFIAPLHPAEWMPDAVEVPMLARAVQSYLGLDGPPEELVLESVAVSPARTLAQLLRDCPITVVSDGLMSYGPTRNRLPVETATRVTRVLHLDLVPGLRPVLLREEGAETDALPSDVFRAVLAEAAALPDFAEALLAVPRGGALVLGQYLSALEIMTSEQEAALYGGMVQAAARGGHRTILFKPHPAAGPGQVEAVRVAASGAGVQLAIVDEQLPAELCFAQARPELVVGCFSTALLTARELYGLPVAAMGTEPVLAELTPYQNSNRIPATIIDAVVPRLGPDGTLTAPAAGDVTPLVEAVSFCMQPESLPELRTVAESYLRQHGSTRYFRTPRLRAVGLLGPAAADSGVTRAGLDRVRALRRAVRRRRGGRRGR
jgi:hypothetical protein